MENIPSILNLKYTSLNWVEPGIFRFAEKVVVVHAGFYTGCFQVTQELYQKITGFNPSYFKGKYRPVDSVSWNDAHNFVDQINSHQYLNRKFRDGLSFQLPSEIQWQFACSGKDVAEIAISSKLKTENLQEMGWFNTNGYLQTMPVGYKEPNAYGLHDMYGNVWEWCRDDLEISANDYNSAHENVKLSINASKIICGASWNFDESTVSSGSRHYIHPDANFNDNGIRLFRY
ncbi:formylglycine-generating enzyme family protein [Dyadobacter sp. CY261]|uniref:formylglycine-generating enzyme family protein n=1 Tax=Dyadobacter sp. CY261 TaxID=2907203 RepID=UPI001F323012|nr:formylglycine-generating enzyme family protein [Dyadobacter sp. CY261]MCF0072225.1 formylglycine-generating enzyme family protein [Dyadobacter sp. CY261]